MGGILSNYEGTGVKYDPDLMNKYYFGEKPGVTVEYCARMCMMGSNCDMFEYQASTQKCRFAPHIALKAKPFYKVALIYCLEIDCIRNSISVSVLGCRGERGSIGLRAPVLDGNGERPLRQ